MNKTIYLSLIAFYLIPLTFSLNIALEQEPNSNYVDLIIKNPQNLGSLDIVIAYNPEELELKDTEELFQDGLMQYNTYTGMITLNLVKSDGINQDTKILRMEFSPKTESESTINIAEAIAYDSENHIEIPYTTEDLTLSPETLKTSNNNYLYYSLAILILIVLAYVLFKKKKPKQKKDSENKTKDKDKSESKEKTEKKSKKE